MDRYYKEIRAYKTIMKICWCEKKNLGTDPI